MTGSNKKSGDHAAQGRLSKALFLALALAMIVMVSLPFMRYATGCSGAAAPPDVQTTSD